jgi:site-specific DNA recombinase
VQQRRSHLRGLAPLGYRNVRVEYEGTMINTVQLDEERAPLVRKAFELYATGDYGLERLEATMADLGLTARALGKQPERAVSFKWLHRMLKDPYYKGYIQYKGELYPGRHEPIVDQALFDRVQEVRNLRSKNGQRDRVLLHYLKGTLFCEPM